MPTRPGFGPGPGSEGRKSHSLPVVKAKPASGLAVAFFAFPYIVPPTFCLLSLPPIVWFVQAQRKIKSDAYYVEKKAAKQLKDKAAAEADLKAVAPVLEQFGF